MPIAIFEDGLELFGNGLIGADGRLFENAQVVEREVEPLKPVAERDSRGRIVGIKIRIPLSEVSSYIDLPLIYQAGLPSNSHVVLY